MLRQDPASRCVSRCIHVSERLPVPRARSVHSSDDADALLRQGCRHRRDSATACVRALLMVVVGASGSGKSSLVLAGVLPRIANGHRVAVVTAGRDAAPDLRARHRPERRGRCGRRRPGRGVRSSCPHASSDALCGVVGRVLTAGACVLMTLRSDFLDRATGLPHIGADLGRGVYAIGPLIGRWPSRGDRAPCCGCGTSSRTGPRRGHRAGCRRSAHAHFHMCRTPSVETWIRREGATLTVAGYEASGGIAGAIAQSAETLYRSLRRRRRRLVPVAHAPPRHARCRRRLRAAHCARSLLWSPIRLDATSSTAGRSPTADDRRR